MVYAATLSYAQESLKWIASLLQTRTNTRKPSQKNPIYKRDEVPDSGSVLAVTLYNPDIQHWERT